MDVEIRAAGPQDAEAIVGVLNPIIEKLLIESPALLTDSPSATPRP